MILSASRRTDIPNYYADWFLQRLKEGFLYVRNPMNTHQISKILLSPEWVDCIVFWTKNPERMLDRLEELEGYPYYFQFTLTGYGKDTEPGLPDKQKHLTEVFQRLSQKIGPERVIWRYDPIFLNHTYTKEYHVTAFEKIAESLKESTCKVIISYIDFYRKTKRNMRSLAPEEVSEEDMLDLAYQLSKIAQNKGLKIESCAAAVNLQKAGVVSGHCVDRELIEKITGRKLSEKKDRNQRNGCGCCESIDIGTYHTCHSGCLYCYATYSRDRVAKAVNCYEAKAPLLCGVVGEDDIIRTRNAGRGNTV